MGSVTMNDEFSQQGVWSRLGNSYLAALRSQLHPRMLLTLLLPVFVGLAALVLAYLLLYAPIKAAFIQWLEVQAPVQQTDLWLENIAMHSGLVATVMGWLSIKGFLGAFVAFGVLLPLVAVLVFGVMAFAIMPIVVSFLRARYYPELQRAGQQGGLYSVINAVKVGLIFCLGWLITLPLWLLPPFAMLCPIFWWAYAFKGFLSVDSVATYASALERRQLFSQYRWDYRLMGLSLALLSFVPLFWIILPVFSALLFAHFSLRGLSALRHSAGVSDSAANLSAA